MAAKRIAGGAGNIQALSDFVTALIQRDARAADSALDSIRLKDNEFGRGYMRALTGMRNSLFGENVDSLIFKILKGGMLAKERKDVQREFRDRRKISFAPDSEKGYSAAWKDVLRLMDQQMKSS